MRIVHSPTVTITETILLEPFSEIMWKWNDLWKATKTVFHISVDTNIINFIVNSLGVNRPLGWDNYVTQPQQQKSQCTCNVVYGLGLHDI